MIEDNEIDSESEDAKEDGTDNDENDAEDDVANRTFLNPSQSEDSDSSTSSAKNIKCEMCDSNFANKSYPRKHKDEIHYWCCNCVSTFESRSKLKSHVNVVNSEQNVGLNLLKD